jgi:hypothetical protein
MCASVQGCGPGVRTVRQRVSGTVIDAKRLSCEHVERHAPASRQAQQPGKLCFLGGRLNVERKGRCIYRLACRSESVLDDLKLQHDDAATVR